MKHFNKRGLAPYISWILIMSFVVSLSVFMYSWIGDNVETSTSQIIDRNEETLCSDVGFSVVSACQNSKTLNMNVTNIDLLTIKEFKIRLFDLYDNVESKTILLTIRPSDTEYVKILKQGTQKQVEIIPVIKSKNDVLCIESMVTLQNIEIC